MRTAAVVIAGIHLALDNWAGGESCRWGRHGWENFYPRIIPVWGASLAQLGTSSGQLIKV